MLSKKNAFLMFLLLLAEPAYANSKLPDRNATVIYAPTINITPDEQNNSYPEKEEIKLLISKEGFIQDVYFATGTPNHIKTKINQAMKQALFTPYKQAGIPIASIVPFVVNFYILSEEDYRGH
mgnify:CR=1 FL=1